MFKSYSAQWIHQPSCSVPYTLLTAVLNHTDLLSSHITLLTHSEFMLTVIPKCFFLNLYFYHAMSFSACIFTVFILSKYGVLYLYPKVLFLAACWKYFNSWLLQFIGIPSNFTWPVCYLSSSNSLIKINLVVWITRFLLYSQKHFSRLTLISLESHQSHRLRSFDTVNPSKCISLNLTFLHLDKDTKFLSNVFLNVR